MILLHENKMTKARLKGILSEIHKLKGFINQFPDYKFFLDRRIKLYVVSKSPNRKKDFRGFNFYMDELSTEIDLGWFQKFLLTHKFLGTYYIDSFYVSLISLFA